MMAGLGFITLGLLLWATQVRQPRARRSLKQIGRSKPLPPSEQHLLDEGLLRRQIKGLAIQQRLRESRWVHAPKVTDLRRRRAR